MIQSPVFTFFWTLLFVYYFLHPFYTLLHQYTFLSVHVCIKRYSFNLFSDILHAYTTLWQRHNKNKILLLRKTWYTLLPCSLQRTAFCNANLKYSVKYMSGYFYDVYIYKLSKDNNTHAHFHLKTREICFICIYYLVLCEKHVSFGHSSHIVVHILNHVFSNKILCVCFLLKIRSFIKPKTNINEKHDAIFLWNQSAGLVYVYYMCIYC